MKVTVTAPATLGSLTSLIIGSWRQEHDEYYGAPWGEASSRAVPGGAGFAEVLGGGRWLTSAQNLHAIIWEGEHLSLSYEGRRHGMRSEFRALLRAAVALGGTVDEYATSEPTWAPWETRDDRLAAVVGASHDA